MGKKVDRAIAFMLGIIASYVLYMSIAGEILPACLLTLFTFALFRRFSKGRQHPHKMSAHQARRILEGWAYLPEDCGRKLIASLLGADPDDPSLLYILRPMEFTLSRSEVFSRWKSCIGMDKITIASTCHADGAARAFAQGLQNPSIELMDAGRLIRKIQRSDLTPPTFSRYADLFQSIKSALIHLPTRKPWTKSLKWGGIAMLLYLFGGNPAYLILSITSFLLAGISLRMQKT